VSVCLQLDHDLTSFDNAGEVPRALFDIGIFLPKQSISALQPLLPIPAEQADNLTMAVNAFRQAKLDIVYCAVPTLMKAAQRKMNADAASIMSAEPVVRGL
jgi:hypothetical protein